MYMNLSLHDIKYNIYFKWVKTIFQRKNFKHMQSIYMFLAFICTTNKALLVFFFLTKRPNRCKVKRNKIAWSFSLNGLEAFILNGTGCVK